MDIKVGDLVQYPDWTGLRYKVGRVSKTYSYQGKPIYELNNGDQLDKQSFKEGAKLVDNQSKK